MNWSAFFWTALWVVVGLGALVVIAWFIIATFVVKSGKKIMNNVFKDFNDDDFPRIPGSRRR